MRKSPWLPWFMFAFLCITWGSSFILMKKGLEAFSPLQIAALRLVIAALTLLPVVIRQLRKVRREEWRYIIAVGIVGNGIPAFLFPLAETELNSASAGVLNALSPLFVLLLGQWFFGFAFAARRKWGVVLGFLGACVLVLGGEDEVDLLLHAGYAMLVVVATVGYGLSTNIMKRHLNQTPATLASGGGFLVAALPYGLYLLLGSDIGTVMQSHPAAWSSLGYIFILGALGTAISLVIFYRLVQTTDTLVAASVTYVIPLVALGWGLLDGETFSGIQYAGMLIILGGVWLAR
ncbi:MAG: EamA family transporter, partial [Bacteroidota bacterium]